MLSVDRRRLSDDWDYVRLYRTGEQRADLLADWLPSYNHHRGHTALCGLPITRVNNLSGNYS